MGRTDLSSRLAEIAGMLTASGRMAMRPLPQDVKMTDEEIISEVMKLLREKRSEENIWDYFKIAYPNVKLTQHHFNKARARMMVFSSERKASMYDDVILRILTSMGRRDVKPGLVEGYFRLKYGTLDHLSEAQFRREMPEVLETIDADPRQARELARSYGLTASESRTAAVKDLAELRKILPEMRKKLEEIDELKRKQLEESNRLWYEATKELDQGTSEIVGDIKDALVKYFESEGIGVRNVSDSGGLVEVFLGSKDGVKRYQSKVSAHISLIFGQREISGYMLRPENVDETVQGMLSDKNTVDKLLAEVKKAMKKGFWAQPEME